MLRLQKALAGVCDLYMIYRYMSSYSVPYHWAAVEGGLPGDQTTLSWSWYQILIKWCDMNAEVCRYDWFLVGGREVNCMYVMSYDSLSFLPFCLYLYYVRFVHIWPCMCYMMGMIVYIFAWYIMFCVHVHYNILFWFCLALYSLMLGSCLTMSSMCYMMMIGIWYYVL